jgi:hypothetical protein
MVVVPFVVVMWVMRRPSSVEPVETLTLLVET